MGHINDILEGAQQRAKDAGAPFEGILLPNEAHQILNEAPGAKIVDVRSRAELDWVGRIPGSIEIELLSYPGMQPNPHFINQLQQAANKESLLMFICRSGVRSSAAAAAAAAAGYLESFNILEGFEGDKNASGHRGQVAGWKANGLPWAQS